MKKYVLVLFAAILFGQRNDEYAMHRDSEAHKAFLQRDRADIPASSESDRERRWNSFGKIIPGLIRTEDITSIQVSKSVDGYLGVSLVDIYGTKTTVWAQKFEIDKMLKVRSVSDY